MIVEIQAELLIKEAFFGKAAEMLDLPYNGKWGGFTLDDWHEDLTKRAAILGINAKKTRLADLEKRLTAIISPEKRREMELAAIVKSLE